MPGEVKPESQSSGLSLRLRANPGGARVRLGDDPAEVSLVGGGIPHLGRQWDEVSAQGLEAIRYRRLVLLFAAMHCRVGGVLRLSSDDSRPSAPSLDAVWQDTALVLGDAFELIDLRRSGRSAESHFRKKMPLAIEARRNAGLTLGVISGGVSVDHLHACLSAFQSCQDVIDETVVCGPASRAPIVAQYARARLIEFNDERGDIRPAICAKKNRIAEESRCENLLMVHERIRPAATFAARYRALSPHFEVLACPLRDTEGNRIPGWNLLPYHDQSAMARIGVRVAEADDLSPMHYGIGSVIFAKRDIYRRVPLDERLHWGEMEDNHWYQQLWLAGVSVSTIEGFLESAVGTGSPAARRENRWLPSRYSMMHRWLPRQCHTISQHAAYTAAVLCRAAARSLTAFRGPARDLIASMPREGRARR